jgi:hypothetical protein
MRLVAAAILVTALLPASTLAAQTASAGRPVDGTVLPDTTYRVVVDTVTDPTHMNVTLQSGRVDLVGKIATLTAGRPNMSFANVHAGDTLMLSTAHGTVLVFKDYGVVSPSPTP